MVSPAPLPCYRKKRCMSLLPSIFYAPQCMNTVVCLGCWRSFQPRALSQTQRSAPVCVSGFPLVYVHHWHTASDAHLDVHSHDCEHGVQRIYLMHPMSPFLAYALGKHGILSMCTTLSCSSGSQFWDPLNHVMKMHSHPLLEVNS